MDFVVLYTLFLCLLEITCKYKEHKKDIRSCHSVTSVKRTAPLYLKIKSQTNSKTELKVLK